MCAKAKDKDGSDLPSLDLAEALGLTGTSRCYARDDDARIIDPRPLHGREAEIHEDTLRVLRSLGHIVQDDDARPWRLAHAAYVSFVTAWWRRDPTYKGRTFFEFLSAVTRCSSRTVLERLRIIGQHYTCEEYLELRHKGYGLTIMAELHRADARLWPKLRALLSGGGMTLQMLALVRQAGELELLRQDSDKDKTQEQKDAEVEAKMAAARVKELKRQADKKAQGRKGGRRKNGAREEGEPDDQDDVEQGAQDPALQAAWNGLSRARAEVEQRAQEAATLQQRLGEQEAKLAAQQQALEAQAAQLRQREAQLDLSIEANSQGSSIAETVERRYQEAQAAAQQVAAERAALDEQQAQVAAQLQCLRDLQEQVATQQEALAAQREALALQQREVLEKAEALAAQHTAQSTREAELAQKDEAQQRLQEELAQQREQVTSMAREVKEAIAGLREDEAELARERQHLELLQTHMDVAADRVIDAERSLASERAALAEAELNLALIGRTQGGVTWPNSPLGPDSTLLCIHDHLRRVAFLCDRLRRWTDSGRLPVKGPALLFCVDNALRAVQEIITATLDELLPKVVQQDPKGAAEFQQAYQRNPRGAIQETLAIIALMPKKTHPGQLFRLPVRALLGTDEEDTPQQGVLGVTEDGKELVTSDMNQPQAVVITGQIGYGKTSSIGVLLENGQGAKENINNTKVPYLELVTHFDPNPDGPAPRWGNYMKPNDEQKSVDELRQTFGAEPQGFKVKRKIVIVPPLSEELMARRRQEYAGMELRVLKIGKKRLNRELVRIVMGTHKKAPLYMMRICYAMERCKSDKPEAVIAAIRKLKFTGEVQNIVEARLVLLEELLGEEDALEDLRPEDFVGLDMRSPNLDEAQAMAIFAMITAAVSSLKMKVTKPNGQVVEKGFMKMVVFDEAHKYMHQGTVTRDILMMLREMRHRRTWVIFACQDPDTLHPTILKLSTIQIVHQTKSVASLRALAAQCAGWDQIDIEELAALDKGWAYVMTTACKNKAYRKKPQKTKIRSTCAKPSGTTLTAVSDD